MENIDLSWLRGNFFELVNPEEYYRQKRVMQEYWRQAAIDLGYIEPDEFDNIKKKLKDGGMDII